MRLAAALAVGTAGAAALLAASTGLPTLLERDDPVCRPASARSTAEHSAGDRRHGDHGRHGMHRSRGGERQVLVSETCNRVELVGPSDSRYVPDIAGASATDRAGARRLLAGVNEFCDTNTAADLLEAQWRPGLANPAKPTHFFNPAPGARGVDPLNPRAALIYDGELGGVMLTGKPLPFLGDIPRAHNHGPSQPVDMLHVYCAGNLREAFTPNRMLGVKADTIALRQAIRPAVNDLDELRLRSVLAYVRQHIGDQDRPVVPFPSALDGPNPERQAKRIEVRTSLMVLDERQLRQLRALMRR